MIKKYKSSYIFKVLTFGLKQTAFRLEGRTLIRIGIPTLYIPIDAISVISFELKLSGRAMTYFYVLTDQFGQEILLPFSLLEGTEYQKLFKDLIKINPQIRLTNAVRAFLDKDIKPIKIRFDFSVNTKDYWQRSKEFSATYPSLTILIAAIISLIVMPLLIFLCGAVYMLMLDYVGPQYESYRIWAIVISGIALTIAIINITNSLVSFYLGHKLTVISLFITIIGFIVAVAT